MGCEGDCGGAIVCEGGLSVRVECGGEEDVMQV